MDLSRLSKIQIDSDVKQKSKVADSKRSPFGENLRNISLHINDSRRTLKPAQAQKEPVKRIVDSKDKPKANVVPELPDKIQVIVDSLNDRIEDSMILELFNSSRQTRRAVLEKLSHPLRRKVLDALKSVKQIIDEETSEADLMPDVEMTMAAEDIKDYLQNGTEGFVEKIDLMPKPLQPLCIELVETDPTSEDRSVILHKIADLFKEKQCAFISDSEIEDFLESDNMGDGEESHDQAPLEIFGNALLDLSETGDIEAFTQTLDENGLLGEMQTTSEDDLDINQDLSEEEADNIPEEGLSDEGDQPTLDSLRLVRYAIKNNRVTDSLKSFFAKRNVIIDTDMATLQCAEEPYHCPSMTLEEYHKEVLLPKIQFFARIMAACGRLGYYCEGKPVSIDFDGNFVYIKNQLGGTKVFIPVGDVPSAINVDNWQDLTQNLVSFDELRNVAESIGEEDVCDFNVYKKNPFKGEWCQ